MSLTEQQIVQIETLVIPLVEGLGFELIEVALHTHGNRRTLVVSVDKPEGINVDDCATLSRRLSALLDVEDPFPFEYHLEVGSPGIFRELKWDKDFARHQGERIKVKVAEPLENGGYVFVGSLEGFSPEAITLLSEGPEGRLTVLRDNIKKLNLEPKLF